MGKTQKFIFVTGGVLSGVGKGITAASIGALLQAKGAEVSIQKCDPYLNVDAGRLDPKEHGEVFVTADGAETDLDLGHYERFLDIELTRKSSTLSGQLLLDIINSERSGKYNGKTVQLVPHLTNAIQDKIQAAAEGSDVHIVEIGGTVGDYEALSFIEAIREFAWRVGRTNCLFVHVVYAPFLETSKEFKTKPAQNALNDLRSFGITPDGVIVRSEMAAPSEVADKIALYGGLKRKNVQLMPNVDTVFRIPELLATNGIHEMLSRFSGLEAEPDLSKWQRVIARQTDTSAPLVRVGMVSDCLGNEDAHLSTIEAVKAAAWSLGVQARVELIDPSQIDERRLADYQALLIPDGLESSSLAAAAGVAKYAYANKKAFLGIGSGFLATIQAFNDQAATDLQLDEAQKPGRVDIKLAVDSQTARAYDSGDIIRERQRKIYKLPANVVSQLEASGVGISGTSSDGQAVQFIEAKKQSFFLASQARIDFASRPYRHHPVLGALMESAMSARS